MSPVYLKVLGEFQQFFVIVFILGIWQFQEYNDIFINTYAETFESLFMKYSCI